MTTALCGLGTTRWVSTLHPTPSLAIPVFIPWSRWGMWLPYLKEYTTLFGFSTVRTVTIATSYKLQYHPVKFHHTEMECFTAAIPNGNIHSCPLFFVVLKKKSGERDDWNSFQLFPAKIINLNFCYGIVKIGKWESQLMFFFILLMYISFFWVWLDVIALPKKPYQSLNIPIISI